MSTQSLTLVLYDKTDVELFFKNTNLKILNFNNRIYLNEKGYISRLYPLTPDALACLPDNLNIPKINILDKFTDSDHKEIIERTQSIENKLFEKIDEDKKISSSGKETFKSILHILLCSIFYFFYILKDTGPWLVSDGINYKIATNKNSALKIIINKIFFTRSTNILGDPIENQKLSFLIKFLNKFIINYLKKRKTIWLTGNSYNFNNIAENIIKEDHNNKVVYVTNSHKNSYKSVIRSFFQILNPFLVKKMINFTILRKKNTNISNAINYLISNIDDSLLKDIKIELSDYISQYINYNESLIEYLFSSFEKIKPKILISHQLRMFDAAVMGSAAMRYNIDSILISHGSHPVPENIISQYELKDNAKGLLFSQFATETIVQSPSAKSSATIYMPKLYQKSSFPVMWGKISKPIKITEKNNQFKILHAGGFKVCCGRPWIYETSNEFLYGLQELVKAIISLENTILVISVRDQTECKVDSLKKLLPKNKNILIKTSGNFYDELNSSDLLVSNSSTVIEEALYQRKPVGLFGGSLRYRHLPGSNIIPDNNKRYPVYHLKYDNLQYMLKNILKMHQNKPLTDEEVKDLIWLPPVSTSRDFASYVTNR